MGTKIMGTQGKIVDQLLPTTVLGNNGDKWGLMETTGD